MTTQRDRLPADAVTSVRRLVRDHVPPGARVLVITRGDDALLRHTDHRAGHFPQTRTGQYAGHHPADGPEAAAHLRELREAGAEFLVVPEASAWWLGFYAELRRLLEDEGELVVGDPAASIYALARRAPTGAPEEALPDVRSLLDALLPPRAGVIVLAPVPEAVDVGVRPARRIATDRGVAATDAALAACDASLPFLVLVESEMPHARDDALRRALERRARAVCRQRLVAVFEGHA